MFFFFSSISCNWKKDMADSFVLVQLTRQHLYYFQGPNIVSKGMWGKMRGW